MDNQENINNEQLINQDDFNAAQFKLLFTEVYVIELFAIPPLNN